MIGERLESEGKFSFGAVVWVLISLGFLGFAAKEGNTQLALFAVLPFCLGAGLWYGAARRFVAMVLEDRIEFLQPKYTLRYRDMRTVLYDDSPNIPAKQLIIESRLTIIRLPAHLKLPLPELHAFLSERICPTEELDPHPDMANYVQAQRESFGSERVEVYRSRSYSRETSLRLSNRGAYACVGVMIAGVIWIVASFLLNYRDHMAWTIWGFVVIFFGGLFCYYFSQKTMAKSQMNKGNADSCLVISPLGIAMIQGDIRGKLRWDEIRSVVSLGKAKGFHMHAVQGMQILVDGSMIQILDIYNEPLSAIETRIRHNCNL
jgi:hypothetical protein